MGLKWCLVFVGLALLVGIATGITLSESVRHERPVCHSVTEDSYISDCDYHDGAWYQR